jgi:nicotinamide phosphoribosyltransferase
MEFNPIFYIDFYKVGHVQQYQKNVRKLWVNVTPRSTRVEGAKGVIWFGLQAFMKEILIDQFQRNFFNRPWKLVESEYVEVIRETLGDATPKIDHIKALHQLGYFPLDIYALPEGTMVPFGVPCAVLVNNKDEFFWLPNYLETMMSNYLWPACTSATTALDYRKIFVKAARAAGETDLSFIDWQGHDFSYRGLMGLDAAVLSGMGHLLSFNGTDTVPAILGAKKYYKAKLNAGGSVNATEHSVMCEGGKENEDATYDRLLFKVHPKGIVSIVSDTWSLWRVLTEYLPSRRDRILARDGKLVIRPDSGDPVKILTGDGGAKTGSPEWYGALDLLWQALGGSSSACGKLLINKGGLIYGDSITKQRAEDILSIARLQGFHPYNFVFGIGSYTYQYVTRDTYNFAFKATAVERMAIEKTVIEHDDAVGHHVSHKRVVEAIFKDPITDNAHKKSHRGIPVVNNDWYSGDLRVLETTDPRMLDVKYNEACAFVKVFDRAILVDQTFDEIRARVRGQAL